MVTPKKDHTLSINQLLLNTPTDGPSQQSLTSVTETLSLLNDVGVKGQQQDVPVEDDFVFVTDGAGNLPTHPLLEGTSEEQIAMTTNEIDESNAVDEVEKGLNNNIMVEKELSEDSDDDISPAAAQQAMDNIFETLQLDPPRIYENRPTFEEFAQQLADPRQPSSRQLADPLQPLSRQLADPLQPSPEKHVPERSEFVSLPARSKEEMNDNGGTEIVNASTAVTPPENLVSLRKIQSEQSDHEEVWPELDPIVPCPKLVANTVASSLTPEIDQGSMMPSATPMVLSVSEVPPVISDELLVPSVSEVPPVVSEELLMPSVSEGPPVVSEELLVTSVSGGPPVVSEELLVTSVSGGPPVVSEELLVATASGGLPIVSEELTMPSASVPTSIELMMPSANEDVPVISDVLSMPSGNVLPLDTTFSSFQMMPISSEPLLAVKSHDTQSDKDLLAIESHDVSHDTQSDKELPRVGSSDQLSQQGRDKGRGKRRGSKKKKKKGLVVAMATTELNRSVGVSVTIFAVFDYFVFFQPIRW